MPFRYTLVFGRKNRNGVWEYRNGISAHHLIEVTTIGRKTGGHWGVWDNCLEWWAQPWAETESANQSGLVYR